MAGADGEPDLVTTEVTEFEVTTLLDAALFDIPQGMNAVMNAQDLSKAIGNTNEAKLAAARIAVGPSSARRRWHNTSGGCLMWRTRPRSKSTPGRAAHA
jgi:hypothetical protein